jgi:hypothetical protein
MNKSRDYKEKRVADKFYRWDYIKGRWKIVPTYDDLKYASDSTKQELRRVSDSIQVIANPHKYSDFMKYKKTLRYSTECDMLMYLGVARKYICNKHKITENELDALLFLYAVNFYTNKDLRSEFNYPNIYTYHSSLLKKKYVALELEKKGTVGQNIYALSTKGRLLVRTFYEQLFGENPVPKHTFNSMNKDKYRKILENIENRPNSHRLTYEP